MRLNSLGDEATSLTILAAVRQQNSYILAADGYEQSYNEDLEIWEWRPADKIEAIRSPTAHIAWGFCGCQEGSRLGEWLNGAELTSWAEVRAEAITRMREINEPFWRHPNALVSILLVGFIQGEAGIICLDFGGEDISLQTDGAVFVGAGAAKLAAPTWNQLRLDDPYRSRGASLAKVLDPLTDRVSALKGPIRLWSLSADTFIPVR